MMVRAAEDVTTPTDLNEHALIKRTRRARGWKYHAVPPSDVKSALIDITWRHRPFFVYIPRMTRQQISMTSQACCFAAQYAANNNT